MDDYAERFGGIAHRYGAADLEKRTLAVLGQAQQKLD